MEHAQHDENHHHPLQPWPAISDPAEELPAPDASDTQTMPGYLTLEIDVSDLRALAPDAVPPSSHTDDTLQQSQESVIESSDLELFEILEPEELSLPGYLTLEVDFEALDHEPPEQGELA